MTTLQNTLTYAGANLAQIENEFPAFKRVQADFLFPIYTYATGDESGLVTRRFSKNQVLVSQLAISDTTYRQDVPVAFITDTSARAFLYYYNAQLRAGQQPLSLQKVLDGLALNIALSLNAVPTQHLAALPFLLMPADQLAPGNALHLELSAGGAGAVAASEEAIRKYLTDRLVLVNVEALKSLVSLLPNVPFSSLIAFLSFSFKNDGQEVPVLAVPAYQPLAGLARSTFGVIVSDSDYNQLRDIEERYFDALWDFPISIPEIKPVVVKGEVLFTGTEPVLYRDLSSYDLVVRYELKASGPPVPAASTVKYAWENFAATEIPDRQVPFDFQANKNLVLDANATDSVIITVKQYDGAVLWQHHYAATDPQLQQVPIELPLVKVPELSATDPSGGSQGTNRPLKGQVVEITGKCLLKDRTVILQAKARQEDLVWRVIGVATTDVTGSFTMPYPSGTYEAAQAITSLAPDSAVSVGIIPPEARQSPLQTISTDFIYLLIEGAECEQDPADADCDCHTAGSKTPRLPDQKDLVGSDKFSQDLGGGTCLNLTTPNRTLSEETYYAIVRTSDPDIANYVLEKNTESQADGFQKVTFTLGDGQQMDRQEVSYENLIRWQDAPDTIDKDNHLSIYQAVNVAHGHLLHYKSVLKADGYSLGDLLYSLPLAPGQKKEIVVFDYKRTLQGAEAQQLTQREGLSAGIVDDRSIVDNLSGSVNEFLHGQSTASTGGVSAGLGVGAILGPVGAVLGVSGGYASSSSRASQTSSRDTSQAFGETLRNAIMQSSNAYREQSGTLIDTVSEGQQYAATTEVVANHNHCHSLTMLYFEVLRHYAVFQELVQVEECIFVPLVMTNFSMENIHKWRDVLAANLLYRPSNTYLPLFRNANPLLKGFDANDRVLTNWANVDFPTNRYCDETITEITGQINFRVSIPRPKTRFDRILSLPIIKKTVTTQGGIDIEGTVDANIKNAVIGAIVPCAAGGPTIKREVNSTEVLTRGQIFDMFMTLDANYETVPPAKCIRVNFDSVDAPLLPILFFNGAYTPLDFFAGMDKEKKLWDSYAALLDMSTNELLHYFSNNVIADWDQIFNDYIAPMLIDKLISEQRISINPLNGLDFTALDKYNGGNRLLRYNLRGSSSLARTDITKLDINYNISFANQMEFFAYTDIRVESLRVNYSTAHYTGTIVNKSLGDDLKDGVLNIFTPLNSDEKRNPRKEDKFIVNELVTHLNSNLEYYNRVLLGNLDPGRRYLLLDGFHIQVYDDLNQPGSFKSLASIVKNQLIGIVGNSLVFPVAAGVKVDRSYIILPPADGTAQETKVSLFDHYRPALPPDPFRISVPTRGVFAEAVMGACDACEKVKDNSSQDWTKFATDEPTAISPLTAPTPAPTDWKAAFKDFAPPIVNIQNAPTLPAPGAGLAGLSDLLGKSDIFKDITGLDGNQKNAMATYLSNQENAKAFAQMAKDMATQAHNTQNDDKIKSAISDGQSSGALTKEEASKLTKDHIQQMIDAGDGKRTDAAAAAAAKPTLTDAAVKAVDQGKGVKAERTDITTGQTEKVDIESGGPAEPVLASLSRPVPTLQQKNDLACWATAATMMVSWKKSQSMTVPDVLALAGPEYVQKFINEEGLHVSEKEAFISALGMVGEPPASYTLQTYIDWVKTYGPLWVTTDSSLRPGVFSPHARILTKITGTGTADGVGTYFTFNDPVSGTEVKESFAKFLSAYEQMVTDNSGNLFIQIVHFPEKVDSGATEGAGPHIDPAVRALNNNVPTATDTIVINKTEFKAVTGIVNWSAAGANHNTEIALVGKVKRTNSQILHLVLHETAADTGDGYVQSTTADPSTTAHMAVQANATVLQFNDLLEVEYHANDFNLTSIGIEFVNRCWLASPKKVYKDKTDHTWKNCPPRGDDTPCSGCEDCDSRHTLYSYTHEAIPAKAANLSAAQQEKFKEANGYLWCFWGSGFNVYRLPQSTAQLEKEVELVKWLTVDLRTAVQAWTDGGWLSGRPELPALANWLSLPGVPTVNQPLLDVFSIENKWLQLVSYNEVKALWTFKAADIPAEADRDAKQYFCFTTGYGYLTYAKLKTTSGIIAHNAFYDNHPDGSFLTLYTWLRLEKNKAAAKAFDLAKDLMKNKFVVASLKTDPTNKKIILLNVNAANLV